MKYSTSADMVRVILKRADDLGIDPPSLLKAAGLEAETLDKPNARISVARLNDLWKAAEAEAGDPHFGLHLGESMHRFPGGGLLFSIIMNSPTNREALEKFCRYHRIINDFIQPVLEINAGTAYFSWKMSGPQSTLSHHVSEALLCIFQSILKHLAGQGFQPAEVWFRHARPNDIRIHQRIFQAPVRFDQNRDALVFREKVLDKEVFLADPGLLETLEIHAMGLMDRIDDTPHPWTNSVIKLIRQNLQGEKPTLQRIARDLAVSGRSLQNRLRDENTSFRMLLDKVRKEMAMKYLKSRDMTLPDIAFILGFSEQSAFNHAFKRWTGQTPTQYR